SPDVIAKLRLAPPPWASISTGRDPGLLLELPGKMIHVGIAQRVRDLADGQRGLGQQGFGAFDAGLQDVLLRGEAGVLFEDAGELVGAVAALFSQSVNGWSVGRVVTDPLEQRRDEVVMMSTRPGRRRDARQRDVLK